MRRLGPQQQFATPGTAAAPGWSFTGYTGSGRFAGSGFVGMSVSGAEVARTLASGNVGNMQTGPSEAFHATRGASATGLAYCGYRADIGGGYGGIFGGYLEQGVGGGAIIYVGTGAAFTEALRIDQNKAVRPGSDNAQNLGTSALRWANLYLVNNPTVSSDATLKTLRTNAAGGPSLMQAELAAWAKVGPLVWTLNADQAGLLHVGYIAQTVQAAFAAQGLDITKYALWHQDTMPDGSTRAALIYAECAVFEAAYQRQQVALLTKQVATLASAIGITFPRI